MSISNFLNDLVYIYVVPTGFPSPALLLVIGKLYGYRMIAQARCLDLPERLELPERPPKYRKGQRIIGI